jgi:hypothetical protein
MALPSLRVTAFLSKPLILVALGRTRFDSHAYASAIHATQAADDALYGLAISIERHLLEQTVPMKIELPRP